MYDIKREEPKTFILIGDGWFFIGNWEGVLGRWMGGNATIKIISQKNDDARLYFKVGSFHEKIDMYVCTSG